MKKALLSSSVLAVILAMVTWHIKNTVFYGSLEKGDSITEVLLVATNAETISKITIFSQWPVWIPQNASVPTGTLLDVQDAPAKMYQLQRVRVLHLCLYPYTFADHL